MAGRITVAPWSRGGGLFAPSRELLERVREAQSHYRGAPGVFELADFGYVAWKLDKAGKLMGLGIAAVYPHCFAPVTAGDPDWVGHPRAPRNGLPNHPGNEERNVWIDYLWAREPGQGVGTALLGALEKRLTRHVQSLKRSNLYVLTPAGGSHGPLDFYEKNGYNTILLPGEGGFEDSFVNLPYWDRAAIGGVGFVLAKSLRNGGGGPPTDEKLERVPFEVVWRQKVRSHYARFFDVATQRNFDRVVSLLEKPGALTGAQLAELEALAIGAGDHSVKGTVQAHLQRAT